MRAWRKIATAALASAALAAGVAPSTGSAITCTITDPNASGTKVGVERGTNSTTVTAEPGAATVPTIGCTGI